MRRAQLTLWTFLGALLTGGSALAAACPYPLGEFAARGHIVTWDWDGEVEDLEYAIVEATLVHGQKSFGIIVNGQGQLHFVYNAEVEFGLPGGGEGETHSIFYKAYSNATGWDVPIQYLASQDTAVEIPEGRNVQPHATALGPDLWTVFETSGRVRENGSYILLRGKAAAGFSPIRSVSFDAWDAANKLPKIVTFGPATYLAFQTNALQSDKGEYQLVGRTWDGTALGPFENISGGNDGWSDQVVALGTDGTRVFAAWVSQNTSELAGQGDWVVKLAVRSADGSWSSEFPLTASTKSASDAPSVAWYLNRVFVAWSTNDPTLDTRGDFDAVMKSFDPATGFVGDLMHVSTDEFHLGDYTPSLRAWTAAEGGDGKLHILWSSDSSPNSLPTSGFDNDIYYTTYDGSAFSAVRLVSDPLDNGFVEILPGFFAVGDSLYAYFLSNICLPGCGHETDFRQMTRLLERPARPYDDVRATYTLGADHPTFAPEATVHLTHADGRPAEGDGYFVRTWDGVVTQLALNDGYAPVTIAYNSSVLLQLRASYCGREILTSEEAFPLPSEPPRPSPVGDVVVPALLAAALLAALGSALSRRPPRRPRPTARPASGRP